MLPVTKDKIQKHFLLLFRSVGERAVADLLQCHQNHQQVSTNLWAAIRARGCQFLGPGKYSANMSKHIDIV